MQIALGGPVEVEPTGETSKEEPAIRSPVEPSFAIEFDGYGEGEQAKIRARVASGTALDSRAMKQLVQGCSTLVEGIRSLAVHSSEEEGSGLILTTTAPLPKALWHPSGIMVHANCSSAAAALFSSLAPGQRVMVVHVYDKAVVGLVWSSSALRRGGGAPLIQVLSARGSFQVRNHSRGAYTLLMERGDEAVSALVEVVGFTDREK